MKPIKRACRLTLALPGSLTSDVPHLREKTVKIGTVARACAIFRVENIAIYPDPHADQREIRLLASILNYLETPQYLRRHLFGHEPDLKYVGVLPPLQTPHHPQQKGLPGMRIGEVREGIVTHSNGHSSMALVGLEKPVKLNVKLPKGTRVSIRLSSVNDELRGDLIPRQNAPAYWGYKVDVLTVGVGEYLRRSRFDLVVATSRLGVNVNSSVELLRERWLQAKTCAVLFGSPKQGLHSILKAEGYKLEDMAHFNLNMVPDQGTLTVRTEEAVLASLAILNLLDE